ncbi:MAG: hypothetical protein AAGF11_51020 [Myxococcota bacterium]
MRRRSMMLLPCLLALTLPACASRYKLDTEPPAYAGQAKIKVKVNKTDNREVEIRVDHLAPPARIDASLRAYVVWIAVPGHGVTKAGVLDYSEKRRRGTLTATTPHPKFEVFISLESNPSTAQPSERLVLRKLVARA